MKSTNEGGFYETGNSGFTFVEAGFSPTSDRKLIITNNKIEAPNCTRNNKHFLRYTNNNLSVIASGNKVQKYQYLRRVNNSDLERLFSLTILIITEENLSRRNGLSRHTKNPPKKHIMNILRKQTPTG